MAENIAVTLCVQVSLVLSPLQHNNVGMEGANSVELLENDPLPEEGLVGVCESILPLGFDCLQVFLFILFLFIFYLLFNAGLKGLWVTCTHSQ